ncbi:MAG: S8 family serine peptidase, partial [Candidatus Latescibacterota bacterium]
MRTALVIASLVLLSCSPATNEVEEPSPEFVPGEVLVKFRSDVTEAQATVALSSANIERTHFIASVGVHRCRILSDEAVLDAVRRCRENPSVEYAEPNYVYRASALPDDPRFESLWAMQNANDADIDADEAWDTQTGARDVLIAIIDTGVDYTHEDLAANMWRNPGESGEGRESNGVDDDGNGFVDDVFGWDFVSDDNDPIDDNAHGSHVAGTVAAVGNNGVGVAGVNWRASVMALKFLDRNGSGSTADAIDAMTYAVENGAHILNNSWGGGGFSQALLEAIELVRDRNALFVAAAGNEGRDNDMQPSYPASYDVENVVAVAASDRNDQLATFSNFGATSVDLAAPGVGILSTTPGNAYRSFDGTSMATPHVSGVAGLILASFPGLAPRATAIRIVGGSDVVPAFASSTSSSGRLNAAGALATAPRVAFVTRWSDTGDSNGPYGVRAEATDDGGVAAVALHYSVGGGATQVVAMQSIGGFAHSGEIPGQPLGSTLRYFVQVTDDDGNVAQSRSFSFRISGEPPTPPPTPECGNFAVTLGAPWWGGSSGGGLGAVVWNVGIVALQLLVAAMAIRFTRR